MNNKSLYKTSFAFTLKPVVSVEKDKYLSKASLDQLSKFIPDFDTVNLPTLLPVAFNICVANRFNKNNDVIDTETALKVYKAFINSPINLNHKRDRVIGCVLTAGFSEFGTDRPLTEEEVKNYEQPFNITLGGVIWKMVNEEVAEMIEESNDPTSQHYLSLSSSWEMGFTDFKIVKAPEDAKNLEEGEIIEDEKAIASIMPLLKFKGGTGKSSDGYHYHRLLTEDVIPLGCGVTQKPAADVEGIACRTEIEEEIEKEEKTEEAKAKIDAEETKNISHSEVTNVNLGEQKNILMLKSIKDLTDENLKQATASQISDLFTATLTEKNQEWLKEKNQLSEQLNQSQASAKKAAEDVEATKKELETIKASLATLEKEKQERAQMEAFQTRMNKVNEAYELSDEVRAAIVEEVKAAASDEDFAKWEKKAAVLLKGFSKAAKQEAEKKAQESAKATLESKASTEVVAAAIDNGKVEAGLPNSSSAAAKSLKEKYAQNNPFAAENIIIKR